MTEFKGTSGPWFANCESVWSGVQYGKDSLFICDAATGINDEDDARLIAAAPDLLEALKAALASGVLTTYHAGLARAAIAKALGESV
ncbi:hypothetical protein [Leminorella grimontii]|uniref:hypothetical protein n=1 Tax=Leminorella grimontii TaxID=82981 RepID=UPI0021C3A0E6|nr:hypothetical protein [Leminorella grimontii]